MNEWPSKQVLAPIHLGVIILIFFTCNSKTKQSEASWIRVNQLGYLPNQAKIAVIVSLEEKAFGSFQIIDSATGESVWNSDKVNDKGGYGPFSTTIRLDFSEVQKKGIFLIEDKFLIP